MNWFILTPTNKTFTILIMIITKTIMMMIAVHMCCMMHRNQVTFLNNADNSINLGSNTEYEDTNIVVKFYLLDKMFKTRIHLAKQKPQNAYKHLMS